MNDMPVIQSTDREQVMENGRVSLKLFDQFMKRIRKNQSFLYAQLDSRSAELDKLRKENEELMEGIKTVPHHIHCAWENEGGCEIDTCDCYLFSLIKALSAVDKIRGKK